MKSIKNINYGLDSIANTYLKKNIDPERKPTVCARLGTNKSIELYKYKMKNGTSAEEYLQFQYRNDDGQSFYFIGLKTSKRYMEWPHEKVTKKLKI